MSLPSMSAGGSGSTASRPYVPPPAPQPYLPGANWTKPVAARDDINATATAPEDQQLQLAADGAPLRVTYGHDRIGADLAEVLLYQNKLVLHLVWGEGEIEAIDTLEMNDAALPATVTATHYTGTAGQTADPTLVAAFASHGITYADALPGIAYSVVVVPDGASEGFPLFAARIRGRKLYDPRTATTVYSDNPALALGDLQANTVYGLDKTVDWDSVGAAAAACDNLVGTEKRRIIGLTCASVSAASQWIETLRTYAGCFVVQGGAGARLIPDRPGASTFSFGATGNSKILDGSLKLKKRGGQQIPTVMRIEYTDTTKTPWATGTAEVKAAGVDAGTTPRRESTVALVGINRYSQAYREAVERINKLRLGDLDVDFVAFDEALAVETGDIVDVSSALGLTAKLVRITAASNASPGRPRFSAGEYDPAMYSDAVQAEPAYADTPLPNPAKPPALTGLTAVEEVYQQQNGTYASRLAVNWAGVNYAYLAHYRVEVFQGGDLVQAVNANTPSYRSPAVADGLTYVVKVAAVTSIGAVGVWAQANVTALGKYLIPGNVPSIAAFEAGGRVYVSWLPAIDIDIWRYEVRYGVTAGTWETATLMDRVDALRLTSDQIPVGTWRIYVKALDSIAQYSTTAASASVTVTSDVNSFLIDSYNSTTPALTNMAEYRLAPTDTNRYFLTESGAMAADTFPLTASSYTNIASTYHANITSTWLGEAEDFGTLLGGQWAGTSTVNSIGGSFISYLGYSADLLTWTYLAGLSQKFNARGARLKHEALTTATMQVIIPNQSIRVEAVPREEVGTGISSATEPRVVRLTNSYIATKKITITPQGSTARSSTYDNVILGEYVDVGYVAAGYFEDDNFSVYIFDSAGTKIASPFTYSFMGV